MATSHEVIKVAGLDNQELARLEKLFDQPDLYKKLLKILRQLSVTVDVYGKSELTLVKERTYVYNRPIPSVSGSDNFDSLMDLVVTISGFQNNINVDGVDGFKEADKLFGALGWKNVDVSLAANLDKLRTVFIELGHSESLDYGLNRTFTGFLPTEREIFLSSNGQTHNLADWRGIMDKNNHYQADAKRAAGLLVISQISCLKSAIDGISDKLGKLVDCYF